MKQFVYNTLCVLLGGVFALTSCINEESPDTPGRKPEADGDAYFSIGLRTEDASSSTRGYVTDDKLEAWEHRVKEVWVLLYTKSDQELAYFFNYQVTNFNANGELIDFKDTDESTTDPVVVSGDDLSFVSTPEAVKRDSYQMVVLANPGEAFTELSLSLAKGNPLSDLLIAVNQDIPVFGGGDSDDYPFFMSNANGLVEITPDDLHETPEEALEKQNRISVKVDRLLAKVIVKEKKNGTTVPAGVILDSKSVQWYLDVANKKTFLIRQFANFADGTAENATNSQARDREDIYATDPNFDGGSKSDFNIKGINNYVPALTRWEADQKDPADLTPAYQYVFENTMSLTAQQNSFWKEYTTQIVLQANLIYTDFLADKSNWEDPDDPGRYYYSYETEEGVYKVFTHAQVRFWLERGFPAEMGDLEDQVLLNLKARENNNNNSFDFKSLRPDMSETECITYFDISYHPMGLNIYKVPVKHFKPGGGVSNPREEVYGYHGIVRNNVYTVTINSLNGPGNNYTDPETHYLSADISVTKWYLRDFQEEDLQ